jgi:hypothetical protein
VSSSSYQDLKKVIESLSVSELKNNIEEIDRVFQNIVEKNQKDLMASLALVETFLVDTLEEKKNLKDVA